MEPFLTRSFTQDGILIIVHLMGTNATGIGWFGGHVAGVQRGYATLLCAVSLSCPPRRAGLALGPVRMSAVKVVNVFTRAALLIGWEIAVHSFHVSIS